MAHEKKWGIYVLDLESMETELVYSSADTISRKRLNNAGNRLVFSQQIDNGNECVMEGSPINLGEEICSIQFDGNDFMRITNNALCDLVPNWSTDDSQIIFLSFRETLDRLSQIRDTPRGCPSGLIQEKRSCLRLVLLETRENMIFLPWTLMVQKTET